MFDAETITTITEIKLAVYGVYLAIGIVVALMIHAKGLKAIDPATEGGGIFFRLLITPGLVALWPYMALKWKRAESNRPLEPDQKRPFSPKGLRQWHGLLVQLLAIILPIVLALAIANREPLQVQAGASDQLVFNQPQITQVLGSEEWSLENAMLQLTLGRGHLGRLLLEVMTPVDLEIPNLALFWCEGVVTDEPVNGHFLGNIWGPSSQVLRLPEAAKPGEGTLALYSLSWRKMIATQPFLKATSRGAR
jgi:hypothetical protein